MNKKALITIGISIVCGLVAILMVNTYMTKKEADLYEGMDLVPVVAAARDLKAGEKITMEMLARREVPSKYVQGSAVDPSNVELAVNQKLNFPLKRGDTLLWTDLESETDRLSFQGMSYSISEKERALSIAVSETAGVAGHISPNDHVDILCTVNDRESGEEATLTLLQNITVLATGDDTSGEERGRRRYSTLTLSVTLEEAEILVFASKKGELTTVLRHPENITTAEEIQKVGFMQVFKSEFRKRLQKNRNQIEVIKRGKTETP